MPENKCMKCGKIIPDGKHVCLSCGNYDDLQTFTANAVEYKKVKRTKNAERKILCRKLFMQKSGEHTETKTTKAENFTPI